MSKSRNTNASQEERLTTWLQNILTIDVHSEVAFSKLYGDYKTSLNTEGRIPLSRNMFSRHFRRLYESLIDENKIILANRNGIQIVGVKLKQIEN